MDTHFPTSTLSSVPDTIEIAQMDKRRRNIFEIAFVITGKPLIKKLEHISCSPLSYNSSDASKNFEWIWNYKSNR